MHGQKNIILYYTFMGWNKYLNVVHCNIIKYYNSTENKVYENVFTTHAFYHIN